MTGRWQRELSGFDLGMWVPMPVMVVWAPKEDRGGVITDFHFEPADGWKPGPMNPEKERIKELCAPVYEWVKTLK